MPTVISFITIIYNFIHWYCQNNLGVRSQETKNFICADGNEIKLNRICDGTKNCLDGSDETRKLCHHIICPSNMFRCYYGACINKETRCDGIPQCADKSDESQCGKKLGSCEINEFRCASGECISIKKICNDENDCLDETDESIDICDDFLCPSNTHRCKHGGCIHLEARCNGYKDCIDGSDESELLCKSLRCSNNQCIAVRQFITCPPIFSERIHVTCESNFGTKKGWIPCNQPVPVDTIARYECKEYYTPANEKHMNNTEMICQPDGTWSREYLKCEPECGKTELDVAPLVVHGWISEPGKWPWHATLYVLESGNWTFWCGGTLITEKVILTAAHCTWSVSSKTLKVALGKYYSDFSKRQDFTQIKDVNKIIMQPLYQDLSGNFGSDIALVILKNSVQFSQFIKPVCIDWTLHDITEHLTENTLGLIVGMGIIENDTFSQKLRATYLPVIADKQCIKKQTRDFKKYVTYTSFCAGWMNGTGVCNGDSGGGLVFPKPSDQTTWVLQGIVSVSPRRRGTSFCDPNYYTVFTKVGIYVDWIQDILLEIHPDRLDQKYLENIIL